MSRRSNHARRGKNGASPPAWLWLLAGLVLGVALSAAAIYGGLAPRLQPGQAGPQPQTPTGAAGVGDEPTAPATGSGRRQYDFYTVLPEMEVLMPDSELQAQIRAETQAPAPATPTAGDTTATAPVVPPPSSQRYRLQAGSYRDPRPAEEQKARLALLGISASVQSVNINGSTWHRVYVGPFTSAAEVEQAKQRLAAEGYDAITVRETTR